MLEHISSIIARMADDLKLHNDRMDAKYGQSDVLPTSDAGIRATGNCNNGSSCKCTQSSNTTTGE